LQKKNSLKSRNALRTTRSQSVGPTETSSSEKRSPKRQSRSATVKERKINDTNNTTTNSVPITKRPRPSSLNTTASSRSKSSSVPPIHEDEKEKLAKSKLKNNESNQKKQNLKSANEKTEKSEKNDKTSSVAAPEVSEPIDMEPVIKSPPEPTRVKSPEQIIMRSPDPVNWTVPLDTGKTFTVTQNVREGDQASRPYSEAKVWTPPELPPPITQSAPPQLTEQCKVEGMGLAVKA